MRTHQTKTSFFSKKPQRYLSFPLFSLRRHYDNEALCLSSSINLLFYWPKNGSKSNLKQSCSQTCPTRPPHPIRMFEDTIRQSANILIAPADTIRKSANRIRKLTDRNRTFSLKKERNELFPLRNTMFCILPRRSALWIFEQMPRVFISLTSILYFTNVKIIRTKESIQPLSCTDR